MRSGLLQIGSLNRPVVPAEAFLKTLYKANQVLSHVSSRKCVLTARDFFRRWCDESARLSSGVLRPENTELEVDELRLSEGDGGTSSTSRSSVDCCDRRVKNFIFLG